MLLFTLGDGIEMIFEHLWTNTHTHTHQKTSFNIIDTMAQGCGAPNGARTVAVWYKKLPRDMCARGGHPRLTSAFVDYANHDIAKHIHIHILRERAWSMGGDATNRKIYAVHRQLGVL